jgi:hypothetical protein
VHPHLIRSNGETQKSITPSWQWYSYNQLQLCGSKSYLGTFPQTLWKWILWWITSKVKPKLISSRSATPLLIALCSWCITQWTCSCAFQSMMWINNSSVTLVQQFLNMPIHSLTATAKHSHHMMCWEPLTDFKISDSLNQCTATIYCTRSILKSPNHVNIFVDFKKAYDSVRMEVLYNNLIDFGIPM